jgi:hypothetical protein
MTHTETPAKHTLGPWPVNGSHIYAPDGAIIAQVHNPGSKESDYPLVANRDLMASAPDLLSQLQFAVKLLGAFPMLNGTAQVQSMRDTIARATGDDQ